MRPTPAALAAPLALLLLAPVVPAPGPAPAPDVAGLAGVGFQQVASGLRLPLLATHAGDGSGRLFLVEQGGLVKVLRAGAVDPVPYLDLRHKLSLDPISENGLLGLAFAPDFAESGRLYASYIRRDGASVLERLRAADPANSRPPADGEVLLALPQAYCSHKGGHVAFGPDGFLYWGLGDGACTTAPPPEPQDPHSLFGKVLRLDASPAQGYAIPADNPYASGGGRPEVWALGLRNPWRWSFDRLLGDLWIADVGRNAWEEVNRQPRLAGGGANYGWRWWEGRHQHWPGAPLEGMTFPVLEYGHDEGCSVTGGYVYRGTAIPEVAGQYLYGDFCNGRIWAAAGVPFPAPLPALPRLPARAPVEAQARMALQSGGVYQAALVADTGFLLSSFGEDEAGELYAVDYNGSVWRLVPA